MTSQSKAVLGFGLGWMFGGLINRDWGALFVAPVFTGGMIVAYQVIRARNSRGRPWRGHGRLRFGTPTKRKDENMLFRLEIDEQVLVNLPPIVDDDGDPVNVDSVEWTTSDSNLAVFEPAEDGLSATLKSRDQVGQITINAKVTTPDGGVGLYTGDISLGLGVPVGGELTFGTPTKRT